MAIQACPKCGAKNRVDENAASVSQPVCGKCGEKLPEVTATASGTSNAKPQVVTDATFASDVVSASASVPVLVDCWAPWCGPCRMIAPVLDQLAAESGGRYKIVKLNVDENPQTSAQFPDPQHPHDVDFQERSGGRSNRRRRSQANNCRATGGTTLSSQQT